MNKKILDEVLHKDGDKNTTSKKFKQDLIEFFDDIKYKKLKVLELGCNRGYSSRILSYIFKKVYAIDNLVENTSIAKDTNKDRPNVEVLTRDVYNDPFNYPQDIRVVWIDAGHDYQNIKNDVERVIEYFNDPIIIFDDYAHPNVGVKDVVQELKEAGKIEEMYFIGEKGKDLKSAKGTIFRPDDNEGVILRLKKKKDVIFMLNIKLDGEGRWSASRSLPYKYSIASWQKWADKNNKDLFILEDLLVPIDVMGICWQRYYMYDIFEANNVEYDQVLMVDADTIVHPETPDFFTMTNYDWTVCEFDGSWDWVIRSMEAYSKYIFDGAWFDLWKYFDAGWILVNKIHKKIYKDTVNFYNDRVDALKQMETLHVGTDQTNINFMVHLSKMPMTHLPYSYNMNDMNRKEILTEDLLFMKIGWIPQYNAIPNNQDNQAVLYWMEKTFKHFYGELK